MILVTHKEKPLPRTGKGTLMRKSALKKYYCEIQTLSVFFSPSLVYNTHLTHILCRYASVESTQKTESIAPPVSWDKVHVTKWLLKQARELNSDKALSPYMDIFEHGFDR